MSRSGSVWQAEGASHRGSSHERSGAPNQDAYAVQPVGDGIVAAVADGHGGRRYVRSGTGARIAVQLATELGAELLGGSVPEPASAARLLPGRLVPAWRRAVLADLATHRLDDDEVERCGDVPADPTILYGATLIVALAMGRTVAVAQIGDGAALGVSGTTSHGIVPGDDRLVANETTSLCLPTALDDFRHGAVTVEDEDGEAPLLLLATDGYGNSFASEQWEAEVMTDLATQVGRHGFGAVSASMPSWVAESAAVGGDDVTVVLLTRGRQDADATGHVGRRRWWVPSLALSLLVLTMVLLVARPWSADTGSRGPDTVPGVTPVAETSRTSQTTTTGSTRTATTTAPRPNPSRTPTPAPAGKIVPATTTASPSPVTTAPTAGTGTGTTVPAEDGDPSRPSPAPDETTPGGST